MEIVDCFLVEIYRVFEVSIILMDCWGQICRLVIPYTATPSLYDVEDLASCPIFLDRSFLDEHYIEISIYQDI